MLKFIAILAIAFGASAAPDTTAVSKELQVSFVGYGPARIGMTRKELEQAIGSKLIGQYPDADEMGCDYVVPEIGYDALSFMIIDDRLVRIDVSSSGVRTISGAQVGDTQGSVLALYSGRWTGQPFVDISEP